MNNFWITWVILPLLIALARIVDVSIGTLRVILISKGQKVLAPILGFFEVIIWLVVISHIINNLNNFVSYIAYGAGFACGTYIGMMIEEKLSLGIVLVRIITQKNADELIGVLKEKNFGITSIDAEGAVEKVKIIYSVLQRIELNCFLEMVKKYNPNAFYTVLDVKHTKGGVIQERSRFGFGKIRKGK